MPKGIQGFQKGHTLNKGIKFSKEHRRKLSENAKKRTGSKNPKWKGGKLKKTNGYIIIQQPNHPYCCVDGYVLEHRLVMEAHLGRHLLPTEVVHHINNMVDDNRIENLMLFSNQKEHAKLPKKTHNKEQQWRNK